MCKNFKRQKSAFSPSPLYRLWENLVIISTKTDYIQQKAPVLPLILLTIINLLKFKYLIYNMNKI